MLKDFNLFQTRLVSLRDSLDLGAKEKELALLEEKLASGNLWKDKDKSQETLKRLKALKEITIPFKELEKSWEEVVLLDQLAEEDSSFTEELEQNLRTFQGKLDKFELKTLLNQPHDHCNAYLSIHAGAGGTESCDWVAMLLRMYLRWMEKNGYTQDTVDLQPGEEAGIKRVVLHVKGERAYGYLCGEAGVHRLVRISPFDANQRRHTSFAAVDVLPEIEEEGEVEIREEDLKTETFRAGGAGGQHVNKTSSAVRIIHIPTGIIIQCQNERSQHQNRRTAMNMLKARLYQIKEAERMKQLSQLYDEKGEIAWGYQIRSYVLHPYNLVKDLRTGRETSNARAVLDGDIDAFLDAYLRYRLANREASTSGGNTPQTKAT
ncbi:MAG TPA: peptide chain release factor 2 [Candidatus Tripitaka californicus]|uniref:peptide chain release factor 2 n=1 Tax=Candidatus Tripitaka californicus TaxID=3367616 RepID=UPI0040298FA9|nr:peptide chain release factor 2 [Planctomycetota bacterium]